MDLFKKVLKMKAGTSKPKGKQTYERMDVADNLVTRRFFLNRRQCEDLLTKLGEIHKNTRLLIEGTESRIGHLEPAFQDLFRCYEKATMLLENCGERAWWCAAFFQWRNENAFREILLELSLCYHLLYEEVICQRGILQTVFETLPNDLRKSVTFDPASVHDVQKDEEDLSSLLEKLVTDPESIESEYRPTPKELPQAQSLASYLLLKMQSASEQSLSTQMEKCRAIMWDMESEHPRSWGVPFFIPGAGSSFVSGWKIEWLGLHCFKKEFHGEGEAFEKMFLKEAAIMAHLKHPNIIQFLCWGKGDESRFIGMELMEKSLFKLIEDQKGASFSLKVILDILWQIARGMCYLHDQGIAHRDLKPHNVMVNKLRSQYCKGYWQVKVIDYGSSKTQVEIEKSNAITYFNIGTGVYRAPEVLTFKGLKSRGRAMWIKADVFSFAMTCVHVLTLHHPFKNMENYSLDQLYDEVMNGKRPSLPDNCPEELHALLRNCWNIIPSKRPTFIDICSRLETIKHGMRCSTIETKKLQSSIDFVFKKIKAESSYFKSLPKVTFAQVNDEDESKPSDPVSIILCTCNKKPELLGKPIYIGGLPTCDMCGEADIDGEVYHCSTCQFDAHRDCAEIREKAHVFYHTHPLLLLTHNYYKNNPEAKCSLCEESIQYSDWVYRCEDCDYDVHARCTKFQNKRKWHAHEHRLTMRLCPPYKSLSCGCCDGEIQERTWHYYCGPCVFSIHLCCAIGPANPLCAFENSHRLDHVHIPRTFYCAFCHTQGHSQFFHCKHCEVDIHLDCIDYKSEVLRNLDEAYEKVMVEKESKDIHAQTILIYAVLDNMLSFHGSKGRLPYQRLQPVLKKVHAPVYEPTIPNESHESLDLANAVKLQKEMISAHTAKRIKAKKLALKKLQEDPLEMLENLEKIVSNLQSFESASEDEKNNLIVVHKRLKEHQQLVKELKATQEESKLCPGPRIGVFYKNVKKDGKFWERQLLIDLQAGMKDVCFGLLCEKPGHEHIVQGKTRIFYFELREEHAENLKPLLACGLHIVKNNITSSKDDLANLESISIPDLGAKFIWDLSAINKIKDMEDMEVLKRAAVSSSEWFLNWIEIRLRNVKEALGLHRIRYRVSDEGSPPCYKNGSIAWLCKEHFDDGLKEGILEPYSSKYHNIEDDYEIRYPPHLREE